MSKKICFVVTISMTVDQFFRWEFEPLKNQGYDISLITDMDEAYIKTLPSYVHPSPISMKRGVDPVGALKAINQMTEIFKREKFDLVEYSTPNASFYASIAAKRAKLKNRLYGQLGLVYFSFSGLKRTIFKTIEKGVCKRSTDVQPVSKCNLEFCRENGFYDESKSRIVWNGSSNGLDLEKFDFSKRDEYRKEIRQKYNIDDNTILLGFLGRVGRDKGFNELMTSFKILNEKYPNLKLLYVGPNERPETVDKECLEFFETEKNIVYSGGWVDNTEKYYAAMDIFIFPSYREGFGNVVVEAEAMGVPVIVSDIIGPRCSVVEGETGYKVQVKSAEAIVEKASILIENKEMREKFGTAGAKFAAEHFDSKILIEKIIENKNMYIERQ